MIAEMAKTGGKVNPSIDNRLGAKRDKSEGNTDHYRKAINEEYLMGAERVKTRRTIDPSIDYRLKMQYESREG